MTSALSDQDICLHAEGVTHRFGAHAVLDAVSLTVRRGEIVTVIGPNGSGKTTLLKILLGLIRPEGGQVWRLPRMRTGYVPQKLDFKPTLPMDVEWFLHLNHRADSPIDISTAVRELDIAALLRKPMHALSGGEVQRTLLARALLCGPDLLVLDEPVQGVDISGQAEMYNLIRRVKDRYGCGVLMVSHDLHLVMAATDHVLCLNHHICCEGHPSEISHDPAFIRLFGAHIAESLGIYVHHHDHAHGPGGEIRPRLHDGR